MLKTISIILYFGTLAGRICFSNRNFGSTCFRKLNIHLRPVFNQNSLFITHQRRPGVVSRPMWQNFPIQFLNIQFYSTCNMTLGVVMLQNHRLLTISSFRLITLDKRRSWSAYNSAAIINFWEINQNQQHLSSPTNLITLFFEGANSVLFVVLLACLDLTIPFFASYWHTNTTIYRRW